MIIIVLVFFVDINVILLYVAARDLLHINCGGANEIIKNNFGNIKYEGDIDGGGSASRNFISTNWGFSSTGDFMDDDSDDGDKYIESNSSVLSMNHSVLYMTARKAPLSFTYFGFCLKNGDYNVRLHFAEIEFTDEEAYSKLGRRIFNIYIQVASYYIISVDLHFSRASPLDRRDSLFICEKLIFFFKKVGVATYFIFIFEGKIKQEIKP